MTLATAITDSISCKDNEASSSNDGLYSLYSR